MKFSSFSSRAKLALFALVLVCPCVIFGMSSVVFGEDLQFPTLPGAIRSQVDDDDDDYAYGLAKNTWFVGGSHFPAGRIVERSDFFNVSFNAVYSTSVHMEAISMSKRLFDVIASSTRSQDENSHLEDHAGLWDLSLLIQEYEGNNSDFECVEIKEQGSEGRCYVDRLTNLQSRIDVVIGVLFFKVHLSVLRSSDWTSANVRNPKSYNPVDYESLSAVSSVVGETHLSGAGLSVRFAPVTLGGILTPYFSFVVGSNMRAKRDWSSINDNKQLQKLLLSEKVLGVYSHDTGQAGAVDDDDSVDDDSHVARPTVVASKVTGSNLDTAVVSAADTGAVNDNTVVDVVRGVMSAIRKSYDEAASELVDVIMDQTPRASGTLAVLDGLNGADWDVVNTSATGGIGLSALLGGQDGFATVSFGYHVHDADDKAQYFRRYNPLVSPDYLVLSIEGTSIFARAMGMFEPVSVLNLYFTVELPVSTIRSWTAGDSLTFAETNEVFTQGIGGFLVVLDRKLNGARVAMGINSKFGFWGYFNFHLGVDCAYKSMSHAVAREGLPGGGSVGRFQYASSSGDAKNVVVFFDRVATLSGFVTISIGF